jgi:hypothetical protein
MCESPLVPGGSAPFFPFGPASSLMAPSMNRRLLALLSFALLAFAASVGCNKPKPGDKCEVGQAVCLDATNIMACQGGVFVDALCRGPGGCSKLGTRVSCDDSIANEGETCIETGAENRACSADKKTSLLCAGGKFKAVQTCRGPGGCQIKADVVTCDSKLAEKGDPCTAPGTFACTSDLKARLVCGPGKEPRFAFDRYCKGPSGCHEVDLGCDEAISDIGDPCGVSGMFACNPDGTAELQCQGGQYVKDRKCPKSGCSVKPGGKIECL